jgi:hypothetical protein
MKAFAVILTLLAATSAFANDCSKEDAQIVGTIVSIQQTDGDLCVAQLSFRKGMYNPNFTCPLDKDVVLSQGVLLECGPVVGSQVDGILYRTSETGPILLY